MNDSAKSVEELQRDAERTRADVSGTLQELRTRLAPDVIKEEVKEYAQEIKTEVQQYVARAQDEVKNYARHTGENWVHTAQQTALEHPVAAAMIGAGLTWKTLGVIRAMGVPGLLLGAGVAQIAMNRKSGQEHEGASTSAEPRSSAYRAYAARGTQASYADWFEAFKAELNGSFRRALQLGTQRASELSAPAMNRAGDAIHEATSTMSDAMGRARHESLRAAEGARSAASEAVSAASRRASETSSMVGSLMSDALEEIRELPKTNPGLVIGAGIAAGAAAAAAYARSRTSQGHELTDMTGRSGWSVGDAPGDWGSDGGAGSVPGEHHEAGFGHETGSQPFQALLDFSTSSPVAFIAGAIAAAGAAASLMPALRGTFGGTPAGGGTHGSGAHGPGETHTGPAMNTALGGDAA